MCYSAADLAAAAAQVGTTEAECEANAEANAPCVADQCAGGTFDGAQAEKCVAAYDAFTCAEYLDTTTPDPIECSTVCN